MKLNIGCGYKKLKGYINIDINSDVKPDFVMSAWNLDFPDNHFIEIYASQVIEHLGFFKTKYFLSEANRTLKKEKFLIIETPHIEKSFSNFLEAKTPEDRERVLNWIYGGETKWMNHLYCFPVELMESLFNEFGFEIYKKEFFDYEYLRPCVRYVVFKKEEKQKESYLRKNLVLQGIFDFEDEIYLSGFEKLIKKIDFNNISFSFMLNIIFESSFFALALNKVVNLYDEKTLSILVENNFNGWLFEVILKYEKDFRDINKAFEELRKRYLSDMDFFIQSFIKEKRKGKKKIPLINKDIISYLKNINFSSFV